VRFTLGFFKGQEGEALLRGVIVNHHPSAVNMARQSCVHASFFHASGLMMITMIGAFRSRRPWPRDSVRSSSSR